MLHGPLPSYLNQYEVLTKPSVTTVTTDPAGQTQIVTLLLTAPQSTITTTNTSSTDPDAIASKDDKSSGANISIGAIIGTSVAVGLVVFALIGCAVWRMKRRSGDEDEAIRW